MLGASPKQTPCVLRARWDGMLPSRSCCDLDCAEGGLGGVREKSTIAERVLVGWDMTGIPMVW